jgi:hypothetical protein
LLRKTANRCADGDGGEWLGLEKGEVLVGGGVEGPARRVRRENMVEERFVAGVAEYGNQLCPESRRGEVFHESVEVELGVVEKDQAAGVEGRDERGECGANETAGTGDEDGGAVQELEI